LKYVNGTKGGKRNIIEYFAVNSKNFFFDILHYDEQEIEFGNRYYHPVATLLLKSGNPKSNSPRCDLLFTKSTKILCQNENKIEEWQDQKFIARFMEVFNEIYMNELR
jgi:hypothetical protein